VCPLFFDTAVSISVVGFLCPYVSESPDIRNHDTQISMYAHGKVQSTDSAPVGSAGSTTPTGSFQIYLFLR
jgi:hypothetical protein